MINEKLTPAIILGGDHNALSIARSLGGAGVQVYAINYPEAAVRYSRFCKWITLPGDSSSGPPVWVEYLLGTKSDHLREAVLFAASDEAIEIIAQHRQPLSERFTLDLSNPSAQLCLLDKLLTYQAAEAAGVPTPRYWVAETRKEVEGLEHELVFPLILKPILGHKFSKRYRGPYVVAHNFSELLDGFDAVHGSGIRTFLVEMIPGPDDKLCSYYTYLDDNGKHLVDFTKRVIRRYPVNMGSSTYHIVDYVPGIQELALALFHQVGLRGLANVEFKMDERDGKLKLIECNARFTAADCLLAASGLNLPRFVYNRLTGLLHPPSASHRTGLRLWKPLGDFLAYRQLNGMGLLSFWEWVRSILHLQVFPVFRWNDPLPSIVNGARFLRYCWSRLWKLGRSSSTSSTARLRLEPQSGSTNISSGLGRSGHDIPTSEA